MIKMIVAVSKNHVIGDDHKLPWSIPGELQFFKKITTGHSLLWGRKTFVNLPRKLNDRQHYVITTASNVPNADKILHNKQDIKKLFDRFRNSPETLIICGGKSIYEQFYKEVSEIYWSQINQNAIGNVCLDLDLSMFSKSIFLENDDFTVFLYRKKNS